MKIDLRAVGALCDAKLISAQKHPDANIWIYNYTHLCQFEKKWDEHTMTCRGLITDGEGNVLARPFKKFFNLDERKENLPDGPYQVFEKMDGSLGILYWIEDKPYIATRGSFTSEQAVEANKMLYERYQSRFGQFDRSKTYLFEIIYPENRIVVNYNGIRDLILLAVVDTETGEEYPHALEGFLSAPVYEPKGFDELKADQKGNREGYVLRWQNGFRVKVKFDEYVRLHKLLTNTNSTHVWEMMLKKENMEKILSNVPDEFYGWVRMTAAKILSDWHAVNQLCATSFNGIAIRNKPKTRKEWAKRIEHTTYPSILFNILDGRDNWEPIMRIVKPKSEKPFKHDIDS